MSAENRKFSYDTFLEFVNRSENQKKHFELWFGVLLDMQPRSPLHQLIVFHIGVILYTYVMARKLGIVFGDNNDFALASGLVLRPDTGFLSKERLPKVPQAFYDLAPDLAVEVFAQGRPDAMRKAETYLKHGARMVWMVYPDDRSVWVYRPADDGSMNLRRYEADDKIDGGEVLPGFSVSVHDLFPMVEVED
jgi:Uma2 family endonuclease